MMHRATTSLLLLPGKESFAWALWGRWMVANALGELIGLGFVAAIAGGLVWRYGEPRSSGAVLLMTALMILLGACEGLVIGYAQWRAVHPYFRLLPRRAWMKATTLGAILAWGLGMIPSTLLALQETTLATPPAAMPDAVKYGMAALMGLGLGLALGVPQWLVLRQYLPHAAWWIPANALAWALGMPMIFFGAGAVPAGMSGAPMMLLVAAILAAAGALVGAVHGWVLLWLLKRR